MIILPLFSGQATAADAPVGEYEYDTTLDNLAVKLRFTWVERDQTWLLSLLTAGGASLITGLALIPDWPLLTRYYRSDPDRIPAGILTLVKTGDTALDRPGFEDLARDWGLVYYTAAEVAASIVVSPRNSKLYIRATA